MGYFTLILHPIAPAKKGLQAVYELGTCLIPMYIEDMNKGGIYSVEGMKFDFRLEILLNDVTQSLRSTD